MANNKNPTVDISFIENLLKESDKIEKSSIKVGSTTVYTIKGTSSVGKRIILVRETSDNEIDFDAATGIVIKIGQMGKLLEWFILERKWKDGGYFV